MTSIWEQELDLAREFAREWNLRNAAGNPSAGFMIDNGSRIDQLVKAFQELDRRAAQAIAARWADDGNTFGRFAKSGEVPKDFNLDIMEMITLWRTDPRTRKTADDIDALHALLAYVEGRQG